MASKALLANSMPKKQAALAGKARNIIGVTPRYRAKGPSRRMRSLKTLRTPFVYVPAGAVNGKLKL